MQKAKYVRPVQVPVHEVDGTHRAFGAREGRSHAGVDFVPLLNLEQGLTDFPMVYAVADGVVTRYAEFYRGTYALEVLNDDGRIVRYCELFAADGVVVGSRITQGQVIARMGLMEGIGEVMLHLEYYLGNAEGSLTNVDNKGNGKRYDYVTPKDYNRRWDLLDPTGFYYL